MTWEELKVNDRIRFVKIPPGYCQDPEEKQFYEKLIACRRSFRICEIDKDGLPWMQCKFRMPNGRWEYHHLAVDDDSWVLVEKRVKYGV